MHRAAIFVLLFGVALARFDPCSDENSGSANASAVFFDDSKTARFTVLTEQLIRMELSPDGFFEDRPSFAFVNRRLPAPEIQTESIDGWLFIRTKRVQLRYKHGAEAFAGETLKVIFVMHDEKPDEFGSWSPAEVQTGNLGGTLRTLDQANGAVDVTCESRVHAGGPENDCCTPGVISREGWVIVDDTDRPLFDCANRGWLSLREQVTKYRDLYGFFHGLAFQSALADFVAVAGKINMPPRYAFGSWFSRYWAYNDMEEIDIIENYENFGAPLDVLIVDMDWHQTFYWPIRQDEGLNQMFGWTGYTWDASLFPKPKLFCDAAKNYDVKTALNLHPAAGIQRHEKNFALAAQKLNRTFDRDIPFEITDEKFSDVYFSEMIAPLHEVGIDFMWLDWQAGEDGRFAIRGSGPTFWLNHLFYTKAQEPRPLIFHRWGGLGNHRYPIGFSGDVYASWKSLDFQVYFTSTAANVGYSYWSHDIGGHYGGSDDHELYTRWVQFGCLSPIMRLHSVKDPHVYRFPWLYPHHHASTMRQYLRLRMALLPYIYSSAKETYDSGVSLVSPMYLSFPLFEDAYMFDTQYFFGRNILVAPVTSPAAGAGGVSHKKIWVPPGKWTDFFTGRYFEGPTTVDTWSSLSENPLLIRAGSVIPMRVVSSSTEVLKSKNIPRGIAAAIFLHPGVEEGGGELFEDDGETEKHKAGGFAMTRFEYKITEQSEMTVTIGAPLGDSTQIPDDRFWNVEIHSSPCPRHVTVTVGEGTETIAKFVPLGARRRIPKCDGEPDVWFWYDGHTQTTIVSTHCITRLQRSQIIFRLQFPALSTFHASSNGLRGAFKAAKGMKIVLDGLYPQIVHNDFSALSEALAVGVNASAGESWDAEKFWRLLSKTEELLPQWELDTNVHNHLMTVARLALGKLEPQ